MHLHYYRPHWPLVQTNLPLPLYSSLTHAFLVLSELAAALARTWRRRMRRMPMPSSSTTCCCVFSTAPRRSGDLFFFFLAFAVLLQSKAMELVVRTSGSTDWGVFWRRRSRVSRHGFWHAGKPGIFLNSDSFSLSSPWRLLRFCRWLLSSNYL